MEVLIHHSSFLIHPSKITPRITLRGDFFLTARPFLCLRNFPMTGRDNHNQQKMKGKNIITVRGHLDSQWKDWFGGLDISYKGSNTILSGNIRDEAQLHGILNKIRDLNLTLISIHPKKKTNNS
jgi:hypothetical protein